MTRRLRLIHLRVWLVVAIVTPIVFWRAFGYQQSSLAETGPESVLSQQARLKPDENADQLFFADDLWRGVRMMTRFFQNPDIPSRFWVQLAPRNAPAMPQTIVYFSETTSDGPLPAGAVFLGFFEPKRSHTLPAPYQLGVEGGYLLLYSPDFDRVWASAFVTGGFADAPPEVE